MIMQNNEFLLASYFDWTNYVGPKIMFLQISIRIRFYYFIVKGCTLMNVV